MQDFVGDDDDSEVRFLFRILRRYVAQCNTEDLRNIGQSMIRVARKLEGKVNETSDRATVDGAWGGSGVDTGGIGHGEVNVGQVHHVVPTQEIFPEREIIDSGYETEMAGDEDVVWTLSEAVSDNGGGGHD